jgi:hypothetical protein
MFNRRTNSLFIHGRYRPHHTIPDFTSHMAEDHDRRAVFAIIGRPFPS